MTDPQVSSPEGHVAAPKVMAGNGDAQSGAPAPSSGNANPSGELLQAPAIAGDADYLSGLQITADAKPGADFMAQTMLKDGIHTTRGNQLLSWMFESDKSDVAPNEQPKHEFTPGRYQWADEDKPYLTAYLNRAAAAGWTQADVDKALNWYKGHVEPMMARERASQYRETENLDRQEKQETEHTLRAEWGRMYEANMRLVNEYFARLPLVERKRLKSEELADGRLALNDPAKLRELLNLASKGKASGKSRDEELAEIRETMRTNRKKYNADSLMQARYRALIAGNG